MLLSSHVISAALLLPHSPAPGAQLSVRRPSRAASPLLAENAETHATLILLRHGQSVWNEANLFTGWADVGLTTLGKNEAAQGATALWREGHTIDVAYTSLLKRAQQTLEIVLKITGQEDVTVHRNWRLNERMYGGLTGLNKKETVAKYGDDQVKQWRRSYSLPPPPIDTDSECAGAREGPGGEVGGAAPGERGQEARGGLARVAPARGAHGVGLPDRLALAAAAAGTGRGMTTSTRTSRRRSAARRAPAAPAAPSAPHPGAASPALQEIPLSECLKDTVERCLPYWESDITPALKRGKTVLVAAHGNSIRGILKYLDGISDDEITSLEVPLQPLCGRTEPHTAASVTRLR